MKEWKVKERKISYDVFHKLITVPQAQAVVFGVCLRWRTMHRDLLLYWPQR